MLITIQVNFTARTVAGRTECQAEKNIHGSYRDLSDVSRVNSVVEYVKKILSSKTISDKMITFNFGNHWNMVGTSRIVDDFVCGREIIKWGHNTTDRWDVEKITAKDIKALYLECVNKALEQEERQVG